MNKFIIVQETAEEGYYYLGSDDRFYPTPDDAFRLSESDADAKVKEMEDYFTINPHPPDLTIVRIFKVPVNY